jgi:hypothetical protein
MIFSTSGYAFAGGSVVDSELRLAASPTHADQTYAESFHCKHEPRLESPAASGDSLATVNISTSRKNNLLKSLKFHLTEIPVPFRIFRAKCIDHISTHRVTTIYLGLLFVCIGAKIGFALLNATCVHNCYQK